MHRTPWEMECHLRHHLAALAADRTRTVKLPGTRSPRDSHVVHVKRVLGRSLIRVGQRLVGNEQHLLPPPPKPAGV